MVPQPSTWILKVQCQEREPPFQEQEKKKRWTELFNQLDLNKDGHIDMLELRAGLAGRGLSKGSLERVRMRPKSVFFQGKGGAFRVRMETTDRYYITNRSLKGSVSLLELEHKGREYRKNFLS